MIPPVYHLALALSSPGGVTATLALSDRSGADLRSVLPGTIPTAPGVSAPSTAIDLNTTPHAELKLSLPNLDLTLGYGTAFSYFDVTHRDTRTFSIIQLATAGLTWSSPRLQLTLMQTVTFGTQSFASFTTALPTPPLAGPPSTTGGTSGTSATPVSGASGAVGSNGTTAAAPQDVTFLPVVQTTSLYSFTSSGRASYLLDRSWTLSAGASYQRSGGAAETSASSTAPPITNNMTTGGAASGTTGSAQGAAPGAQTPLQGAVYIPTFEPVEVRSLGGFGSLAAVLDRRWSATVGVLYQDTGGADASSLEVFPRQKTRGGNASVLYLPSAVDQVLTSAQITNTTMSTDARYLVTTGIETWRHRFSPELEGYFGAGASFLHYRTAPDQPLVDSVVPAGQAGATDVLHSGRATLTLRAATSLLPTVNPLAGLVQQELTGVVDVVWMRDPVSVTASADAAETFPRDAPYANRIAGGALTVTYAPAPFIDFLTGGRAFVQQLNFPAASGDLPSDLPPQWVVFVGIGLHVPLVTL